MKKLFLIAGPCIIESRETAFEIARRVKDICEQLDIKYIFKGSYTKANRTRLDSFSGIGEDKALTILQQVREKFQIPVLTDVHESQDCEKVAEYVDYLQIPAFLCRQTALLIAAGSTGKGINIKKGQFLSPEAMKYAVDKVLSTGNKKICVTERGSTFGYDSLVVDFTSIPRMKKFGATVVVDCTHSVQKPNQVSGVTGGDPELIETLCFASLAARADGLFLEVHPDPKKARSDSESMLKLENLEKILEKCIKIRKAVS